MYVAALKAELWCPHQAYWSRTDISLGHDNFEGYLLFVWQENVCIFFQ